MDTDNAIFKIQVGPFQAQNFSPAETTIDCKDEKGPVFDWGVLQTFKKHLCLFQGVAFLLPPLRMGRGVYMDDLTLEQMAVEERRRYQKEWRAKNKDKVRAQNQKFWIRQAQKRLAAQIAGEKEG